MSIDITWSTLHRVNQQSSQEIVKGTYIDIGWLSSRHSSDLADMHWHHGMVDFLLSPSLPDGYILGLMSLMSLMTQGGREVIGDGRSDDRQSFQWGYLGFC
jgi:hypothetical protein